MGYIEKYQIVTKYLYTFTQDIKIKNQAQWDFSHKGSMPHIEYSTIIVYFMQDVNILPVMYPELGLDAYGDILKDAGIENITEEELKKFDYSNASAQAICSILLRIVNRERMAEGLLANKISDGTVTECLQRLVDINRDQYK